MLKKGTSLPARHTDTFATPADNLPAVDVPVTQAGYYADGRKVARGSPVQGQFVRDAGSERASSEKGM